MMDKIILSHIGCQALNSAKVNHPKANIKFVGMMSLSIIPDEISTWRK